MTTRQMAERSAEQTARRVVDKAELPALPLGELGDPASMIAATAEERAADVIVVGTHERSWFDRLLDDSVGEDVRKDSGVPVLVGPPHSNS
jgi:nucleotide-binding universal stress UspA family protein